MYFRNAGDEIAANFQKLMSGGLKKKASDHMGSPASDSPEGLRELAEDMLLRDKDEVGASNNPLDDEISDIENLACDPESKEARIMRGLGKIAASLRGKGEGFAADFVETTAKSINKDFIKEAKAKNDVTTALSKIALSMNYNGKRKGAMLISKTINNIKSK